MSARLLASACSCAQRLQVFLEGLGAASNVLLLTGVGASFVASYLSHLTIHSGLRPASNELSRHAASGFADSMSIGIDLQ